MAKPRTLTGMGGSFTPPEPVSLTDEDWKYLEEPYGSLSSELRSKIREICDDYLHDRAATAQFTTAAEYRSELNWWHGQLSKILKRLSEFSNGDDKHNNKLTHLYTVMNRKLPIYQNLAIRDKLKKQGLVGPALVAALRDQQIPDRPWRMAPDVLKDMALMRDAITEELTEWKRAGNPFEAKEESAWDELVRSLWDLFKNAGLETSIRGDWESSGKISKFPRFLESLQRRALPKHLRKHLQSGAALSRAARNALKKKDTKRWHRKPVMPE